MRAKRPGAGEPLVGKEGVDLSSEVGVGFGLDVGAGGDGLDSSRIKGDVENNLLELGADQNTGLVVAGTESCARVKDGVCNARTGRRAATSSGLAPQRPSMLSARSWARLAAMERDA
jgi:hypothetical protein